MAKAVKYPTKTPDKKTKGKVTKKEREKGGYGMVVKEGIAIPPKRKK